MAGSVLAPAPPAAGPKAPAVSQGRLRRALSERRTRFGLLNAAPVVIYLLVLFVYPIFSTLLLSLKGEDGGWTLHWYADALQGSNLKVLLTTLRISAETSLLSLVIGFLLAAAVSRLKPLWAGLVMIIVIVPHFISALVRTYGWIILLGEHGVINDALTDLDVPGAPFQMLYNELGVVIGTTSVMLPYTVLLLYAVMKGIDHAAPGRSGQHGRGQADDLPPDLPADGRSRPGQRGHPVLHPLPRLLPHACPHGRPEAGHGGLSHQRAGDEAEPVERRRRSRHHPAAPHLRRSAPAAADQGAERGREEPGYLMIALRSTLAGRIFLTVASTVILLFLALPIVLIVVTSFGKDAFGAFPPDSWTLGWYKVLFADGSKWPAALSLSALIASLTTAFSLLLGITAATALVRSNLPLRSAVYGLVLAPLVIPQVVIALGLFLLFELTAMLGSPIAIALGHTVLASPIAVMILMATLKGIDERLEDAAASMGATVSPSPGASRSPWRCPA